LPEPLKGNDDREALEEEYGGERAVPFGDCGRTAAGQGGEGEEGASEGGKDVGERAAQEEGEGQQYFVPGHGENRAEDFADEEEGDEGVDAGGGEEDEQRGDEEEDVVGLCPSIPAWAGGESGQPYKYGLVDKRVVEIFLDYPLAFWPRTNG